MTANVGETDTINTKKNLNEGRRRPRLTTRDNCGAQQFDPQVSE
jgi:hypothetical protein